MPILNVGKNVSSLILTVIGAVIFVYILRKHGLVSVLKRTGSILLITSMALAGLLAFVWNFGEINPFERIKELEFATDGWPIGYIFFYHAWWVLRWPPRTVAVNPK
jgi:uncharacterized membrane protein